MTSEIVFFFSSRRRHTRFKCDWSSDVCSSDLDGAQSARRGGDDLRNKLALNPRNGAPQDSRNVSGSCSGAQVRSEERRVGEEGRSRGSPDHLKKKRKTTEVQRHVGKKGE